MRRLLETIECRPICFLPKNFQPPFQTVIYWPGSGATWYDSSEEFLQIGLVEFLIKNGPGSLDAGIY